MHIVRIGNVAICSLEDAFILPKFKQKILISHPISYFIFSKEKLNKKLRFLNKEFRMKNIYLTY